MSTIVSNNVQIGQSGTATNNFTLYQPLVADGTVRLANGNTGSTTDLVTVTSAGNVGIGTASPSTKLHVSGNITINNDGQYCFGPNNYNGVSGSSVSNSITVWTNNNPRVGIDSNGVLSLNQGQLKFPNAQNASSDPNTLDDYEEGTWTPVYVGSASNPTIAYGGQTGYYVKVGRTVYFWFYLYVNTTSGGSGDLQITGLPFSSINVQGGCSTNWAYAGWTTQMPQFGHISSNTSTILLSYFTTTSTAKNATSNLKNGCELCMHGSYQTNT